MAGSHSFSVQFPDARPQEVVVPAATSRSAPLVSEAGPGDTTAASALWSRNVRLAVGGQVLFLLVSCTAFGTLFDAYLWELAHHRSADRVDEDVYDASGANTFVGAVETVRGLSALALAKPVGLLLGPDRNKRAVLRLSALLGLPVAVFLLVVILGDAAPPQVYIGAFLLTAYAQCTKASGEALVADEVPAGSRIIVGNWQNSLNLIATSVGPLLQASLILLDGDRWKLSRLHAYLGFGMLLWPLSTFCYLILQPVRIAGRSAQTAQAASTPTEVTRPWLDDQFLGVSKRLVVPVLVEVAGLVTSVGAGMTTKFFALFFKQEFHFTPVHLNLLSGFYGICITVCVQLCRRAAANLGRVQAVFLFHLVGTVLLFRVAAAQDHREVLILYVVRGALMNARAPINRAIVADCVPSASSSRLFGGLQSMSRFGWSASAFLGGMVVDAHGYRHTFRLTAAIYMFSAFLYLPLLFITPRGF